jgi:hypothetical protein
LFEAKGIRSDFRQDPGATSAVNEIFFSALRSDQSARVPWMKASEFDGRELERFVPRLRAARESGDPRPARSAAAMLAHHLEHRLLVSGGEIGILEQCLKVALEDGQRRAQFVGDVSPRISVRTVLELSQAAKCPEKS